MVSERPTRRTPKGDATRRRILEAALELFGSRGYSDTRLEDIAEQVGLSRPAVLKHFGSKEHLFVETYQLAMQSLPGWFDGPQDVIDKGFWSILRYWFRKSTLEGPQPRAVYQIFYIGRYTTNMSIQHALTEYMRMEDPEGTLELVSWAQERGDIHRNIDPYLAAALVDWVLDGFQGSAMEASLDRSGLFRGNRGLPDARTKVVDETLALLRQALSHPPSPSQDG